MRAEDERFRLGSEVLVSQNLYNAHQEAVRIASQHGNYLDETHLLLAIARSEGNGTRILDAIAYGKKQALIDSLTQRIERMRSPTSTAGLVILRETNISVSHSLSEILVDADSIAKQQGQPLGTDHIILADIERPNSILKQVLIGIGVMEPIEMQIKAMAERIGTPEPLRVRTQLQASEVLETVEQATVQSPDRSPDFLIDLLQKARRGEYKDMFVRPKWTADVLHSLDSQPITVLITDHEEEARAIVANLAGELSRDRAGVFGYRTMIAIDPEYLEANPAGAINQAVSSAQNGVLFIPDLQRYLRPVPVGTPDIGLPIRKALAGGRIRVITSFSEDQWHKVYDRDDFARVKPLYIEPPTVQETVSIIQARKANLERSLGNDRVNITLTAESINEAARLADRYRDALRTPPAGAVALIRRAAVDIKITKSAATTEGGVEAEKVDTQIDPIDIQRAFTEITGIEITLDSPEKYLKMEEVLGQNIIGQPEALAAVSNAIRRAKAGLKDERRPIGSFIFMGPSGVGKTELSRVLAQFMFGDEEATIVLDMSEFGEKQDVAKLIGAPPGYVGYEEGGRLTEAVRKKPYSIVVFDEIEKCHPDVRNALLQILEEGRLTDGHGRTVDFRNTVIIMTGNIGSRYFAIEAEEGREKVVEAVEADLKDEFPPEFLNRPDKIVVFNSLKPEHIRQIVDIQMKKLNRQLAASKGLSLQISDDVKSFLVSISYRPEYGARELRRSITDNLSDPLSTDILSGAYQAGDVITASMEEGKVVFKKQSSNP